MNKPLLLALTAALSILGASAALAASSPTVTNERSSAVSQTSATLGGTINPDGAATSYSFQYGPTTAFGTGTAAKTLPKGTKAKTVTASLSRLTPGTKYYYRLVASNAYGAADGITHTFTTTGAPPPGATTGAAADVGRFSATLTGVVDTDGAPTTYTFQYGMTTTYASDTAAVTIPASSEPVPVTVKLDGLQPGAVFHYRLVAEHGVIDAGSGADMTFRTEPYTRPAPHIAATTTAKGDALTTSGRIEGPKSLPDAYACTGSVSVGYYVGRKEVHKATVDVTSNCTYRILATVRNPSRHKRAKVTVKLRFGGNGYIAPASARNTTATLKPR